MIGTIVARCAVAVLCLATAGCSMNLWNPFGSSDKEPAGTTTQESRKVSPTTVVGTAAPASRCSRSSGAERRAREHIVLIRTTFGASGATQFGAGIVIAARAGRVTIVTARHVVEQSRGGSPQIEVALGEDEKRFVAAQLKPFRAPPAPEPLNDIAVIEASAAAWPGEAVAEWQMLRPQSDAIDLGGVLIIGNPANRGKRASEIGSGVSTSPLELRINGISVEQGYSGGAAFDIDWQLAGLVFEDRGSYAAAYPIIPVLRLLEAQGIAVDAKPARPAKRGVYLANVRGQPDELVQLATKSFRSVMQAEGLDPECDAQRSRKLSLKVSGQRMSGTTSVADIEAVLVSQNGAQLATEREQLSVTHMSWSSPWGSSDSVDQKMSKAARDLLKKVSPAGE